MQNKVKNFNENVSINKPLHTHARLMDIASEIGELAKEYLYCTNYGNSEFTLSDSFKEEFGDVMYSLLSLASEIGFDAEESLDFVIDKYTKRIEKKNNMGSEG